MIDYYPMRVFRWTLEFRPKVEYSIVPIWVELPNLPLFMFNKQCLFSIGRLIGSPLALDMPRAEILRPSMVKVCIHLDVLKKHPNRLWLLCGEMPGYWLDMENDKFSCRTAIGLDKIFMHVK